MASPRHYRLIAMFSTRRRFGFKRCGTPSSRGVETLRTTQERILVILLGFANPCVKDIHHPGRFSCWSSKRLPSSVVHEAQPS